MSSESLASNKNSPNEAIDESRSRCDSSSDSGSNADISARARSLTQGRTFQDEVNDSATSFLNSSDENNHEVKLNLPYRLSMNDTSSKAFAKSERLFSNNQKTTFTGKASSLERPTAIRRVSSLSPLEKPLTKRYSSLDSLEVSLTKGVSSLDPLEEPSVRTFQSLDPLEGPSSRRFQSLDPLEGPSTRRVSSLDPLEGPSTRRVSSLDPLEGPSTRRVSSLDPLEGPSSRKFPSLDPLEGPSTRRVSSLDPLEGPSTRKFPSLDPLEGPSSRRSPSLYSLEEALTRIDPAEASLTSTEKESVETIEVTTEQNRCVAWLKSFLRRSTRQFRNSVFYLVFLVALSTLPISAGYMGTYYLQLCGGCRKLPVFVYLVGLLGICILSLQIINVITRRYFSPPLTGEEFDVMKVVSCFTLGLFLVIEAANCYLCEPVFIPPNKQFCLKVFYNYTFYANIGALLVILLLMLIHIPGCNDPAEFD